MSREARSRGACWTCRLRRKKCDECTPACLACTSQHIPCYGYDPNPVWTDGGAKQKAKVSELRNIVREVAKTRWHQKRQGFESGTVSEDPGHFDEYEHGHDDQSPLHQQAVQASTSSSKISVKDVNSKSLHTAPLKDHALTISELDPSSRCLAPNVLEGDSQGNLLMHYLDVVFPNQFPFYKPSPEEGGRGWLLIIILRTKPLYHAALSTAAYHQQAQSSQNLGSKTPEKSTENNLQAYHSLAIKELRLYLDAFRQHQGAQSLERNIEVLVCIVFLISLEVFNGDTESWQIHLKAAQNILPGLRKGCTKSLHPNEPLSPSHRKAHHFFAAVICWYEIFSTTTTGLRPWAPRSCLEEPGFIDLESIMGCTNSVVIAIREIASLHEWKSSARGTDGFDERQLVDRASSIEKSLEELLEECFQFDGRLASHASSDMDKHLDPESQRGIKPLEGSAFPSTSRSANTSEITRIFACAALVYVNVLIFGPRADHPKIQKSVSRTTIALGALQNRDTLRLLVWPVCLAGCMATNPQIDFFRHLCLEFNGISDGGSGNLKKSFLIMEECWRLRETAGVADWLQAMESLNMKILLI